MTEIQQFIRDADSIRMTMKKTLGEKYEDTMAHYAMKILDHQSLHQIDTSLMAAIHLYKCMHKEGYPTDRLRAASIWWECHKVYFFNALYELFDED